jgi:hypothetical protein
MQAVCIPELQAGRTDICIFYEKDLYFYNTGCIPERFSVKSL